MQTFLPYSEFEKIGQCLDDKRLNKQIQEADTLIDLHLEIKDNSWKNHPAFKMWSNYINALIHYRNVMLDEWIKRGKNSNREFREHGEIYYPSFLQNELVILSHRSNLIRKFPEHYSKFGWIDYGIEGYYWPCEVKTSRSKKINEKWTKTIKGCNYG